MRVTATDADGVQHIIESDHIEILAPAGLEIDAVYDHNAKTECFIFKEENHHGTVQNNR